MEKHRAIILGCLKCRDTGLTKDGENCGACCEHEEHDHYVCLNCGKELDPGQDIDRAEYWNDQER